MINTRREAAGVSSHTPLTNITPASQRETSATITASYTDLSLDDDELTDMLASLSKESGTLVKISKTGVTKQIRTELEMLSEKIIKKITVVDKLGDEIKKVKIKVNNLESRIYRVEQYARRDTIMRSGPSPPAETLYNRKHGKYSDKKEPKSNINQEVLSDAPRLAAAQPGRAKPNIFILVNRWMEYDIIDVDIKLRPKHYVIKNLTPKELNIFIQVLSISKQH